MKHHQSMVFRVPGYLSILLLFISISFAKDSTRAAINEVCVLDFLYVAEGGYEPLYSFEKNIERHILFQNMKADTLTDQNLSALTVLRGSIDYLENAVLEDEEHLLFTAYDLAIWGVVEPLNWPQDYNLTIYLYLNPLRHPYSMRDIQLRIRQGRITAWDKRPCNLPEETISIIPEFFTRKLPYIQDPAALDSTNLAIRKHLSGKNLDISEIILSSLLDWNPGAGNGSRSIGYIQLELDGQRHIIFELDKRVYGQLERFLSWDLSLRWPLEQSSMVMPDIAIESDVRASYIPAEILVNTGFDYTTDKFLIGILPFRNQSQKEADNWIGYGLEYILQNKLSTIDEFQLLDKAVVTEALAAIDTAGTDTTRIKVQSDQRTFGYNLGISGNYSVSDTILNLELLVLNTLDGDTVSVRSYNEDQTQLLAITEEIVRDLFLLTEYTVSPAEDRNISGQLTSSLEALELFCRGQMEAKKNDRDNQKVIEYYQQAIKADPQFWEAHYSLGITYFNNQMYNDALSTFEYLIDLFPGFARPYLGRGLTYFQLDNRMQAERDLQAAIRIDDSDYMSHFYLGRLYILEKRYEDAIPALQLAARLHPGNTEILYQLGNSFYGLRKYKQALPYFEKALQKNPQRFIGQQKLGECYYHANNFKRAKQSFDIVLAEKPDNPEANFMLGITVYKQAILDDFIDAFLEMFKISMTTNPQNINNKVDLQSQQAKIFREMIRRFKKAAYARPDFFEATFNLAMTFKELGRVDSALTYYQNAIAINPKSAKAHLMLAKTYELRDQRNKALDAFKEVLKLEPAYFVNDPYMGEEYHHINLVDIVTAELEEALKEDPDHIENNLSLARIYYTRGFYGRAANLSRRVLSIHPDNENAKRILAQVGRI